MPGYLRSGHECRERGFAIGRVKALGSGGGESSFRVRSWVRDALLMLAKVEKRVKLWRSAIHAKIEFGSSPECICCSGRLMRKKPAAVRQKASLQGRSGRQDRFSALSGRHATPAIDSGVVPSCSVNADPH